MSQVKAIPEGYNTITPYLMVKDSKRLIKFLQDAFNATTNHNMQYPDGSARHAELQIGTSKIMLSEATPENPATPIMLYLYLEDADKAYNDAIKAGGVSIMEPKNTFYGDRNAAVKDHSGNQWWVATHVEDISAEEVAQRAKNQC